MFMKRPTDCRPYALTVAALVAGGYVLTVGAQEPPISSSQQEPQQQEEPITPSTGSELDATQSSATSSADPASGNLAAELQSMDADGDGTITASEQESGSRKMFDQMDADRDGEVTASEMRASVGAASRSSDDASPAGAEARIAAVDRNADGKLTAEEHAAHAREMFGQLDGDKDGSLSQSEMQTAQDWADSSEPDSSPQQ
jgi:Ca2+-binding EF-hand superfamily protein